MNEELEARLWLLLLNIEAGLNRIQAEASDRFDWLARSVGQKLRVDRATK